MEVMRLTEQERNEPLPKLDRDDAEAERSGSGPPPGREDAVTPTEQAANNQEQALESGEENAV